MLYDLVIFNQNALASIGIAPILNIAVIWSAVSVLVGTLAVAVTIIITVTARRDAAAEKRSNVIKEQISHSISDLENVLVARLETKENVNVLAIRFAATEARLNVIERRLFNDK
jgi:hypothetical protein